MANTPYSPTLHGGISWCGPYLPVTTEAVNTTAIIDAQKYPDIITRIIYHICDSSTTKESLSFQNVCRHWQDRIRTRIASQISIYEAHGLYETNNEPAHKDKSLLKRAYVVSEGSKLHPDRFLGLIMEWSIGQAKSNIFMMLSNWILPLVNTIDLRCWPTLPRSLLRFVCKHATRLVAIRGWIDDITPVTVASPPPRGLCLVAMLLPTDQCVFQTVNRNDIAQAGMTFGRQIVPGPGLPGTSERFPAFDWDLLVPGIIDVRQAAGHSIRHNLINLGLVGSPEEPKCLLLKELGLEVNQSGTQGSWQYRINRDRLRSTIRDAFAAREPMCTISIYGPECSPERRTSFEQQETGPSFYNTDNTQRQGHLLPDPALPKGTKRKRWHARPGA